MNVTLFVATSLDGYVADAEGGIGWLFTDGDYGYAAFLESVSALAMGRKTYEQVLTFGEWPNPEQEAFVFSRTPPAGAHPHVTFTSDAPADFVEVQRRRQAGDLWLVGGGSLVASFRRAGLIDAYVISVHPILLGSGIPLFEPELPRQDLRLTDTISYPSGLVQLHYAARRVDS